MELFEVRGWSVPAAVSNPSKHRHKPKRRRDSQQPVEGGVDGVDRSSKKRKRISKKDDAVKQRDRSNDEPKAKSSPSHPARVAGRKGGSKQTHRHPTDALGLTALQQNFKDNLDGARFR